MSVLDRVVGRPTWLLSRANARAQALLSDAFSEFGVRGYHFRVLAALDQDGPSSQAAIGHIAGMDRSDVTATIDNLASWGLVTRVLDPADRRRNVVSITDAGVARLKELDATLARVQDAVLQPLTAQERATLLQLLAKLGRGF